MKKGEEGGQKKKRAAKWRAADFDWDGNEWRELPRHSPNLRIDKILCLRSFLALTYCRIELTLAMHSIGLHLKLDWLHFQGFLQVTTNYDILSQFLRYCYKWRQLHQLPDRTWRRWSVYSTFSFQVLLLTILNTAATQVLEKRKRQDSEGDSFRRHRRRIFDSDGLMVQYQLAIIVKHLNHQHHLSYLFSYCRFWRQATSSCVGNLSVTVTRVIVYMSLPIDDVW